MPSSPLGSICALGPTSLMKHLGDRSLGYLYNSEMKAINVYHYEATPT